MAMRRVRVRFARPVDPAPLAAIDGVTVLSRENDTHIELQVEGEMDGLIKSLAAFPVSDFQTEQHSLEEVFLAYYESDDKEVA